MASWSVDLIMFLTFQGPDYYGYHDHLARSSQRPEYGFGLGEEGRKIAQVLVFQDQASATGFTSQNDRPLECFRAHLISSFTAPFSSPDACEGYDFASARCQKRGCNV